jgi:hypothetical protein
MNLSVDCSVNLFSSQHEVVLKSKVRKQQRLQGGEGLNGLQREHAGEQEKSTE